jgi:hypothetical protein
MRFHDFPALESAIRSSTLGQWAAHIIQTLRTAGANSQIKAKLEILRAEISSLGPAERHRGAGVVLMGAAVTCYGLSRLQPPHQIPLVLPVIALAIFAMGAAVVFAGDSVARASSSSSVWSLWRRFMTSTPEKL